MGDVASHGLVPLITVVTKWLRTTVRTYGILHPAEVLFLCVVNRGL